MKRISRRALKSINGANFMCCGFTVFWAVFSVLCFWPSAWGIIIAAILTAAAVAVLWFCIKASGEISALPDDGDNGDKREYRIWNIIFIGQGIGIGVTCAALGIFDRYEYMLPAVTLWVGVHFIPIGLLNKTIPHFIAAAAIIATTVIMIMVLPPDNFLSSASGISSAVCAAATISLAVYNITVIRKQTRRSTR